MDDPDVIVMEHARQTILECGEDIIPQLEALEEESIDNPRRIEHIKEVLNSLRFQRVKNSLTNWLASSEKNLLEAIFIINSYQFPELKIEDFTEQFHVLKHRCWLKMNSRQTSFEKVEAINRVFFEEFAFVQPNRLPYSPFEIFLNSVLDTKEGTDLSLGLIYSLVAQSLELPVYGVTTMNHRAPFVLAYLDKSNLLPILNWGIDNNGVLFYIQIDAKGNLVDPQHFKKSYFELGLPQNRAQFEPSPNSIVMKKYLRDIRRSFANQPYYRYKLQDIDELLGLFPF